MTNQERINLRLKSSAKNLLERAAGFEGKTVSNFILRCALERAETTIKKHETTSLNSKNSQKFYDALNNPIRFNSKLINAFKEHAKRIVSK